MKKAFLLLAVIIFLTGCPRKYYPGIFGSHIPTHIYTSSSTPKACMIQSDLSNAGHYYFKDSNLILRNHISYCNRSKYFSLNSGLLLYGGKYEVVELTSELDGSYHYFGAGPEVNINTFLPLGNLKIGVGYYGSLVFERGSYYDFMKKSDKTGFAENDIDPLYLFSGVYGILALDISQHQTILLQGSITKESPSIAFASNYKKTYLSIAWTPYTNKSWRRGIYKFGSFSLGIAYKI